MTINCALATFSFYEPATEAIPPNQAIIYMAVANKSIDFGNALQSRVVEIGKTDKAQTPADRLLAKASASPGTTSPIIRLWHSNVTTLTYYILVSHITSQQASQIENAITRMYWVATTAWPLGNLPLGRPTTGFPNQRFNISEACSVCRTHEYAAAIDRIAEFSSRLVGCRLRYVYELFKYYEGHHGRQQAVAAGAAQPLYLNCKVQQDGELCRYAGITAGTRGAGRMLDRVMSFQNGNPFSVAIPGNRGGNRKAEADVFTRLHRLRYR